MKYESPEIPEGINVSKTHPLVEFAWLLAAVALIGAVLVLTASFAGEWLAGRVSVEQELSWTSGPDAGWVGSETHPPEAQRARVEQELQVLADRLLPHVPYPEGMPLRIHYSDADTVNAFATLGGHIVFFRGLLERLPHENALAMVMAHEMAHVAQRHPIRSIGRGAGMSLALALMGMDSGNPVNTALGQAGLMTAMSFSREQEREADRIALDAVNALYGHVGGAGDLFRVFQELRAEQGDVWRPEFASTHPSDEGRIQRLADLSGELGFPTRNTRTPLPALIRTLSANATD
ncbi:MAG: M48 family metallopeptidase [Gammaproteobacteria bacterium]